MFVCACVRPAQVVVCRYGDVANVASNMEFLKNGEAECSRQSFYFTDGVGRGRVSGPGQGWGRPTGVSKGCGAAGAGAGRQRMWPAFWLARHVQSSYMPCVLLFLPPTVSTRSEASRLSGTTCDHRRSTGGVGRAPLSVRGELRLFWIL